MPAVLRGGDTTGTWHVMVGHPWWEVWRGKPGPAGAHTCTLSNLQGRRARCLRRWPGLLLVLDPGSLSLPYEFLWAFL